jgi:acyl-CoA thioesterase-2
MSPTSQTFLRAIELTPVEPPHAGTRVDAAFTAVTQYVPWPKAYGGDLVAQAAASASLTAGADRRIHSMHSYFMRPADIGSTVRYEVERLRDGRSYSTREVRAYQDEKAIFVALASFHAEEEGDGYAESMPADIPDPEGLPSSAQVLAGVSTPAAEYWSTGRSFDMRHVPGPLYLEVDGARQAHQAIWIRSFERLPDDPQLHRLALAYVCDYTILEPILRQQGRAWGDPGLVTASLDHSLWFHRDGRLDEWVLYAQQTASAQHGRGLARGSFFSRTGTLLATVSQEGMIRVPRDA